MINAVKSIPPNTCFEPLVWTWVNCCLERHLPVETCIENCYLRNCSQQVFDYPHAFQFRANMQRRKCGRAGDGGTYFGRDRDRIFEIRTAVYDPVSCGIDLRGGRDHRGVAGPDRTQQFAEDLFPRGHRDAPALRNSARLGNHVRRVLCPFDPPFPKSGGWIRLAGFRQFCKDTSSDC